MEEQQRQALAKRLTELRRYKGWSEADLWQKSGVSIQTISRLENGHTREPRENTLRAIAKAFGITRDDLAGPRVTPEEVDDLMATQLDRIEQKLDQILLIAGQRDLSAGFDVAPADAPTAPASKTAERATP